MSNNAIKIFAGSANPRLAQDICDYLDIELGRADVRQFSDGETLVELGENVRGMDVFLIQSTCAPANSHVMELLILLDAVRRASAKRITVVTPYYGYSRQDRKVRPRSPISARLIADLLSVAGAQRVLCVDLHAGQIQGFFNVPLDELNALYPVSAYFAEKDMESYTVVATDVGGEKRARDMAIRLDLPLAIVEKRRVGNTGGVEAMNVIGDVAGRNALLVDDEIDTAGTMVEAVNILRQKGAREIVIAGYHAILSGPALDRLRAADVHEVVVTDTVPLPPERRLPHMHVIPTAPLFGDAIERIHTGQSVGALFQ